MSDRAAQQLIDSLEANMRAALKARDNVKTRALKLVLSRISNAQAVPLSEYTVSADNGKGVGTTEMSRKDITATDIEKIIRDEVKELEQTITILPDGVYKSDLAEQCEALTSLLHPRAG